MTINSLVEKVFNAFPHEQKDCWVTLNKVGFHEARVDYSQIATKTSADMKTYLEGLDDRIEYVGYAMEVIKGLAYYVIAFRIKPPNWSNVTSGKEVYFSPPIDMGEPPPHLTDEQIAEICKAFMIPIEVMFAWSEKG